MFLQSHNEHFYSQIFYFIGTNDLHKMYNIDGGSHDSDSYLS